MVKSLVGIITKYIRFSDGIDVATEMVVGGVLGFPVLPILRIFCRIAIWCHAKLRKHTRFGDRK